VGNPGRLGGDAGKRGNLGLAKPYFRIPRNAATTCEEIRFLFDKLGGMCEKNKTSLYLSSILPSIEGTFHESLIFCLAAWVYLD
jgi:hypothetical protein